MPSLEEIEVAALTPAQQHRMAELVLMGWKFSRTVDFWYGRHADYHTGYSQRLVSALHHADRIMAAGDKWDMEQREKQDGKVGSR